MAYHPPKKLSFSMNLPDESPIFEWVRKGDLEKLKSEIKTLEDIDKTDRHKNSLSKIAATHGQQKVLDYFYQIAVSFFLENSRINNDKYDYKNRTIIHWAAKCNLNRAVFETFIAEGVDIDRADNPYHVTPLYIATQDNCSRATRVLIELGANIETTAVNGATALHVASENGNNEIIAQLIAGKADINKTCQEGGTPLFIAAKKGHLKTVEALIAANADTEKAFSEKITPLVVAMEQNHIAIVKALLAANAKTDYQLPNGWSLKQFAKELKNPELVEFFAEEEDTGKN